MLGLLAVWLGLATFLISCTMLLYRPAFNDITVTLNLWLLCPLGLTCAGIVLWSTRKEAAANEAVRLQAWIGSGLALVASAIIYGLIYFAQRLPVP